MTLFFKKRPIKNGLSRLVSLAIHPFSLKVILLSFTLGAVFLFRTWTEREAEKVAPIFETSSVPLSPSSASLPPPSASPPIVSEAPPTEKVDLNRASAETLETLPGIGPKLAKEIIDYREQGGVFRKGEDLLQVKGIGIKRLHRIEPYLTFGPE